MDIYRKLKAPGITIKKFNKQNDIFILEGNSVKRGKLISIKEPWSADRKFIFTGIDDKQAKFYSDDNIRILTRIDKALLFDVMMGVKNSKQCYFVSFLNKQKEISIEAVVDEIEVYFIMFPDDIYKKTRKREIVQARQLAMFFSKKYVKFYYIIKDKVEFRRKITLEYIGEKIGGKDHATVLHAFKTVNNLADSDKCFKRYVKEIDAIIKNKYKV